MVIAAAAAGCQLLIVSICCRSCRRRSCCLALAMSAAAAAGSCWQLVLVVRMVGVMVTSLRCDCGSCCAGIRYGGQYGDGSSETGGLKWDDLHLSHGLLFPRKKNKIK